MKVPIHCDDVYASWLGAAAGLMVEGGQILLLDHQDVLTEIYLGWQRYRILLRESPQLKAMQVNAWNGQWVAHRLGNRANVLFHPDSDGAKLNTIGWVQLLFALAYHMREGPATVQTIYIYALGQTNETVGFVNLNLPKIRLPVELYSRLFTVPEGMPPMAFEELYDTACGLKEASRFGEIGTSAIRPRMAADPGKTAEKQLKFDTYRTWLIAMLDNKELYERAQSFARELMAFQSVDERGKSTRKSAVDELLKQKTRKGFVDALSGILEKGGIDVAACEATVTGIVELPVDRVPLYISLINFSFRALAAK